jgi:hypothetical protein
MEPLNAIERQAGAVERRPGRGHEPLKSLTARPNKNTDRHTKD